MINGIFKQTGIENVPASEVRGRKDVQAERAEEKQEKAYNQDELLTDEKIDTEQAVQKIVSAAKFFNREIRMELEKDLNMMIVKVVDGETDEVIRQIPAEEFIELSKNAKNLKGLLIDKEG